LDPSHWQPLTYVDSRGNFVMQDFSDAHWCFVTPFALPSEQSEASQSRNDCPMPGELRSLLAPGPAKYGDPEYTAQAQELVELSSHLTDRQKMIAEFWVEGFVLTNPSLERSDASEPDAALAHWLQFAEYVSDRDHHSLDDDVKMYFALSNALMDTGIATAATKRTYNSVRPITAITFLYKDKRIPARSSFSADANPASKTAAPAKEGEAINGSQWMPYQPISDPTPPSPEFVSAQSAYSAAAARILALWTGSDRLGESVTLEKGSSKIEPGITPREPITLHWDTFSQAANQAGMSGRYAGIHFRRSDLAGRALGRAVADLAWTKAQSLFNGSANPEQHQPARAADHTQNDCATH
jgi:VCPO second helical-bundle domain